MERHEEMLSPEEQYAQLAPTLDTDGFSLYAAAEEATGLKVYEEFPYEDNRGMFEGRRTHAAAVSGSGILWDRYLGDRPRHTL